ncbi:MAG TPA: hypothetical protein PLH43_01940 [Acetivibrio sp.]|uniref:hypothetical protein n=1 Tax=Acetivibrio sp. TaxID=1872092 RepID=UPI002CA6B042|nr:hypothetical protein [Acetivibrio sp.]HOM01571.1 hypothetical protein [Acetivibrio sp.]
MSAFTYIASNNPLPEVKNPHYKTLSINEALSMGIEVPDFLLDSGCDRDKPDVILWSDIEIKIDTETGTVDDGGFDDDFAILKLSNTAEDVYTEKKYCAYLEWNLTRGRSQKVIDYIREQLEYTDEIEIWRIWMGSGEKPLIKKRTVFIDALTPNELMWLEEADILSEPPTQYCIIVKKL